MSDNDLNKYRGENHPHADNSAPYPVSRMAPATELVDMAREIAEADRMLGSVTHGKLKVIAEQMKALQAQARTILEASAHDQKLHRARCNFKRQPGKTYHLYCKADESLYFSMLAPAEWGGTPPHSFVGSYRLESDMSWTPVEEIGRHEPSVQLLNALLNAPSS